jgi:hypothetical protein
MLGWHQFHTLAENDFPNGVRTSAAARAPRVHEAGTMYYIKIFFTIYKQLTQSFEI